MAGDMTTVLEFEGNRLAGRGADLFGFAAVAERVAGSMADQTGAECFVVGLEGEWGSGKSTLLSLLEEDLGSRSASVVRFSPWTIGSRDALLAQLFAALEKAVAAQKLSDGDATDETVRAARDGLSSVRRHAGAIAAVGRAAELAGGLGWIDIQRSHIMVAARWTKPAKWMVRRSYRVAKRRRCLSLPKQRSMRLRCL